MVLSMSISHFIDFLNNLKLLLQYSMQKQSPQGFRLLQQALNFIKQLIHNQITAQKPTSSRQLNLLLENPTIKQLLILPRQLINLAPNPTRDFLPKLPVQLPIVHPFHSPEPTHQPRRQPLIPDGLIRHTLHGLLPIHIPVVIGQSPRPSLPHTVDQTRRSHPESREIPVALPVNEVVLGGCAVLFVECADLVVRVAHFRHGFAGLEVNQRGLLGGGQGAAVGVALSVEVATFVELQHVDCDLSWGDLGDEVEHLFAVLFGLVHAYHHIDIEVDLLQLLEHLQQLALMISTPINPLQQPLVCGLHSHRKPINPNLHPPFDILRLSRHHFDRYLSIRVHSELVDDLLDHRKRQEGRRAAAQVEGLEGQSEGVGEGRDLCRQVGQVGAEQGQGLGGDRVGAYCVDWEGAEMAFPAAEWEVDVDVPQRAQQLTNWCCHYFGFILKLSSISFVKDI